MKIVYLYTSLTTVGGADRIVIQKANYLADVMGHEVYVITDSQAGRAVIFPLSPKVKHIDLDINFDRQYRHGLLFTERNSADYWNTSKQTLLSVHWDVILTS